MFYRKVSVLIEVIINLAVVTPFIKTGYHFIPHHMSSNILLSFPYSNVSICYKHFFACCQNVHLFRCFKPFYCILL